MTPAGAIDGFSAALHATPLNIIAGPDGALWFTEGGLVTGGSGAIGRITTSGSVSEYVLPTPAGHDSEAWELVVGPDGNLWFSWITLDPSLPASTATGSIGRITPSGTITEFPLPAGHRAAGITRGPDGNLWFADDQGSTIGQMTTSGAVTMYPVPTPNSSPSDITTGSDGNLWFSEFNFASSKIGRLSLTGAAPPPVVPVVTPSISSFSPASGSPGTAVAVAGSNLLGTTSVRFGVTLQPTYSIDPTGTLITTTVPAGATTGPITIVTPWGTAVSAASFGVTGGPSSHVRNVTLRLRQHLRAEGRIVVEDGFVACAQHRRVRVQRRDGNGWRTVAAGGTDVDGRYSVTVTDRTAWYRATIAEITLPSGDVCDAAISGTRHHAA
jgi:streptogramin lyase